MSSVQSAGASKRWSGRPIQAALLRAVAFIAPIAASIGFVDLASKLAPAPLGSLWIYLLWWLWLSTAATLVLVAVEWMARKLLPLAALLKLSLVFPDQTPSRFKTAMRAGSTKKLEARMQELRDGDASPAESAALLLELVAALNSHDQITRGHCERVRAYSVLIGQELGLSAEEIDLLNWSALLHDVGKLSVPRAILNKAGRPDEEEWQLLKAHPLFGEDLVGPLRNWLGEWADAVGYHHERWDGAGYPRGVEGEDIPLPGRIVAVADVYDVITSARSYKEAGGAREGREEIGRCAGSQFDPGVVRAFLGVSIGRMRLIMGPVSWLSHAPILSQIPFASVGSAVSGALGVLAAASAGGLVANVPAEAARAQAPIVRHVAPRRHPAPRPTRHAPRRPHVPVHEPAPRPAPASTVAVSPPPTSVSTPTPPAPPTPPTPPTTTSGSSSPPPPASSPSVTHAERDSASVLEGGTVVIDVLANDTNSSGDALAVRIVKPPNEGTATVADDKVTYTAPPDWAGTTSFQYRAASRIDGSADTALATVTVVPVNHPPSFAAGADPTVPEDSGARSVTAWATQVSPGPANESGQDVSFDVVNDEHGLFSEQPAISPDGTLTFKPAANAHGVAHLTVTAHDDGGTSNGGVDTSRPQNFSITVTSVNDRPSFAGGADQMVLESSGAESIVGWATSISPGTPNESGQALDFETTGDTNPSLFSSAPAVDPATGTLTFTSAPGAYGSATVTFALHDDGGTANGGVDTSPAQSLKITVVAPPTPQPDSFNGWSGSNVVGSLLGNDTDPQGSPLTLQSTPAVGPANGTVTLNSSDGTFVYVPNPGFTGTDGFTYTVANGYGAIATAQVTITISVPTGVSTSLVAAAGSKDSALPYHVMTASFTPVDGATYLVFAGRVSSSGDTAVLTTLGSLDLPLAPVDGAVGADGATHGWVWVVHGTFGGLSSSITVTFTNANSKSVASDVLEVVQVGGSGVDHDTATPGVVSSKAASVPLASPGASDSELAFLYVNGDIASDPGWNTSAMATLSGSVLHSPNGSSGYGALVAYASPALASAATNRKIPSIDGNSYVAIAVDLLP